MAMQCNIDARGKRVRFINGIIMIIIALILMAAWAWPGRSIWGWAVASILLLCGGFSIFESRKSWCALRAMGIKTRV